MLVFFVGSGSCHGRCNEKYNTHNLCNCHADCKTTEKCCGDYSEECNAWVSNTHTTWIQLSFSLNHWTFLCLWRLMHWIWRIWGSLSTPHLHTVTWWCLFLSVICEIFVALENLQLVTSFIANSLKQLFIYYFCKY